MGNFIAIRVTNNSKRTIRVYITEKEEELDSFVNTPVGPAGTPSGSENKNTTFLKGVKFVRVQGNNTKDVPTDMKRYVSLFLEDEKDQSICAKEIALNMVVTFPVHVQIFDLT